MEGYSNTLNARKANDKSAIHFLKEGKNFQVRSAVYRRCSHSFSCGHFLIDSVHISTFALKRLRNKCDVS